MTAHPPDLTPAVLDNEAALLGALLRRPELALSLPVRADHYARPVHGVVHQAIVTVAERGEHRHNGEHGEFAAVLPVLDVLRERADANRTLPLLRNGTLLLDYMRVAGDASWHAEQVIEAWQSRELRTLGIRLQQLGDLAEAGAELTDVVEHAMAGFLDTLDVAPASRWDPPTPLTAHRALPPFPVGALPAWVADQVAAVAEFTQTPPDLAGCVALAALSTAAGGRATIQIRPGWTEPTNLYTAVAMPPGSRKSAVFAAMTAPLLHAEHQLVERARPLIVEAELARRTAQRDAERYATNAANTTNPQARAEALAMATDAALAADNMTVATPPRLVADDVTPEAAASLLAEHHGRLAVLSAEGGIFTTLAGKYTGGIPSLEVFLKGHAGDLLRVDRKGRPAEHIPHPALTLGLALQPEVLRDIARIPGFRGRGLLARILYALPANTVGHRRIGTPPVPDHVSGTYHTNLRSLVLTLANLAEPALLQLTTDADTRMLHLEAQLEPRLADGAELGHIADWAAKLNGAIARLAALLHLATHLRDGWNQPVDLTTVDNAAQLGHYYLAHALATFNYMGADPTTEAARTILHWITRGRHTRFTRRDLMAGSSRSRFRKAADLDAPLHVLLEHGYIRPTPTLERTGPGRRPSPAYDVHPDLINATTGEVEP